MTLLAAALIVAPLVVTVILTALFWPPPDAAPYRPAYEAATDAVGAANGPASPAVGPKGGRTRPDAQNGAWGLGADRIRATAPKPDPPGRTAAPYIENHDFEEEHMTPLTLTAGAGFIIGVVIAVALLGALAAVAFAAFVGCFGVCGWVLEGRRLTKGDDLR